MFIFLEKVEIHAFFHFFIICIFHELLIPIKLVLYTIKFFIPPQVLSHSFAASIICSYSRKQEELLLEIQISLPVSELGIPGLIHVFSVWLLLLNTQVGEIEPIVFCISLFHLFLLLEIIPVYHHSFFTHSLIDGHSGCFCLWFIMEIIHKSCCGYRFSFFLVKKDM